MSGTVVFEDAKLQAVELIAETVTLNNFSVSTATTFQQTTNASNVTTNTLRFTNPETAFVTTGNVEVGTANLFVDTTTSSVGIGTTSPGGPLHVKAVGSTTLTNESPITNGIFVYNDQNSANQDASVAIRVAGSSAGDPFLSFDIANEYGWAWGMDNSDGNKMKLGANWHTVSNDTKMTIDTSGNVGIGTTDPKSALHVTGAVNYANQNTPGVEVGVHASNYAAIEMTGADGYQSWIDFKTTNTNSDYADRIRAGTGHMGFYTNNGERMRIDSSGNVGIGTNNPSAGKLDIFVPDGGTGIHIRGGDYGTNNGEAHIRIGGSGASSDNISHHAMITGGHTSSGSSYLSFSTLLDYGTHGNSPVERMRINQYGNVGIGTTSPLQSLNVKANGENPVIYMTDGTNNRYGSGMGSHHVSNDGQRLDFYTGDSGANGTSISSSHIRMSIRANGNVGIGTVNPSKKLHVQGGAAYFRGNGPAVHIQPAQTTGGGQNLFTGFRTGNSYGRGQLVLSSAYSDVIIASSQINNNHGSNLSFVTYDPNNYNAYRKFVINQGNWGSRKHFLDFGYGDKADPNPHGYINGTDTVMTLDGVNKRMGIGSITPGYKLTVNGSLYYTSGGLNGSDDRIKYNEQNISNALTLISQLKPQKYEKIMEIPGVRTGTWIPTDEEWENVKEDYTYGEEFGFIAQDVRKIPELNFLVKGEETRTETETVSHEKYSNLSTEEQITFTHSYTDGTNIVTQEEYTNLEPTEQELYVQQYTKQTETETPLGLNYQGLFVVAIGAIQELKLKNDTLEARIAALENA